MLGYRETISFTVVRQPADKRMSRGTLWQKKKTKKNANALITYGTMLFIGVHFKNSVRRVFQMFQYSSFWLVFSSSLEYNRPV